MRFRALCAAAGALLLAGLSPAASAPKQVTIALAEQLRVGYYWLYLPDVLGYWKAENLSVDVVPVGGSVEALQQVVAGHAQFGQMGADNVIEANDKEPLIALPWLLPVGESL